MMRSKPPFRADMVGSLLRTLPLKQARLEREAELISADELRAVEDREIRKIIRMQEEIGLNAVTDGEFRRAFWHFDFIEELDGVEGFWKEQAACGSRARRSSPARSASSANSDFPHRTRCSIISASCRRIRRAPGENDDPVARAWCIIARGRDMIDRAVYPDMEEFLFRPRRRLCRGGPRLRRCRLPLSAARRRQLRLSLRPRTAANAGRSRRRSGTAARASTPR